MSSIIKVDTVQDQDGNNIINENANTITIGASGDTITIPSGATLANNGTATGFASIAWQSSIVTAATITVTANKGYWIDTTSNACTITLPASAAVGDRLIFTDYLRTWATNTVIINQNSLKFQGGTTNPVYNTAGQSVDIVYSGATQGWIPNSDDDVTNEGTFTPYDIDFLVVAGGGGGGQDGAGGGGAGGFRTSTQTISSTITITTTVGDGGVAGSAGVSAGSSGSDSSISGSGLTTITSAGGGGGASSGVSPGTGGDGGSAGGGGTIGSTSKSGGSGDTPSTSPSQGNDGGTGFSDAATYRNGGGGGGASANGGNGNTASGNGSNVGGAGTASSITGSSVTYAGGGGGGSNVGTVGAGGAGGGGAGSGVDGTANTGGGGGGTGGTGGKGVVILSMPDASYSGTTTGSPTVATGVSGKTILTFTGTGSYST